MWLSEPHFCSITRVTRSLLEKLVSPPVGRNRASFFTNIWLTEPNVREKDKKVPCCRRRRLPLWEHMSDLYAHRVTRVNNTRYVVPPWGTGFASGRAEETIFFHKNLHIVQIFVKKDKKVLCCRRRSWISGRSTDRNRLHRVTRVNYRTDAVVAPAGNLPPCRRRSTPK